MWQTRKKAVWADTENILNTRASLSHPPSPETASLFLNLKSSHFHTWGGMVKATPFSHLRL